MWRSLVPLDHHPVDEHARIEIAANKSEHPDVRDPLGQSSHQHVVIHPIEEFLQIDVHDEATAVLHITLCATHGIVRPPAWPETVACI